tara:strand:+ start:28929 stop:29144 length:216 start_codon:yes stop_codon:yes gene_type:complete
MLTTSDFFEHGEIMARAHNVGDWSRVDHEQRHRRKMLDTLERHSDAYDDAMQALEDGYKSARHIIAVTNLR